MAEIFFKVNQFLNPNIDKMLSSVSGTILTPTVSLCHHCHSHIPAYTYHKDNQLWMVKTCKTHGISHHMIERDYEFYANLTYTKNVFTFTKNSVMTEVTDRCNANCPHCYHIPDNSKPDYALTDIIAKMKTWYNDDITVILAGAEPSLRPDFFELLEEINLSFPKSEIAVLSNGIRFADKGNAIRAREAGLKGVLVGLNHPSYLANATIRKKQLAAIDNCYEEGLPLYYIGYTMSSVSELHDILNEITTKPWDPPQFRIRYGSDIGRFPEQERLYVSDTYKLIKQWCIDNGKTFEDSVGDNNLYHTMVKVEGKLVRVIQWCDETDINMEELRTGPYCDFVPDGLTNFLHQVIRRDVYKNKGIILPDTPPARYLMQNAKKDIPIPNE